MIRNFLNRVFRKPKVVYRIPTYRRKVVDSGMGNQFHKRLAAELRSSKNAKDRVTQR